MAARSPALAAPRARRLALGLALLLLAVVGTVALSRVLPFALLDFEHYLQATRALWQRQNPYGAVEFFAPPWMALLLGPFLLLPVAIASAAWVLLQVAAVGGSAVLAVDWLAYPPQPRARLLVVALAVLAPPALYNFITGQATALVGLAALLAAGLLATGREGRWPWLAAGALWLTLLKPHVVLLLGLVCGLELVRRRARPALAALAALLAAGALFGWALLPAWPQALARAWLAGDYLGGAGLVAAGYRGLADLGIPGWAWLPLAGYVIYAWWRRGLTPFVAALALPAGLLLVPYHRSYDQVVLILPVLFVLARSGALPSAARRWLARGLVLAALIIPFVGLSVLVPLLVAAAVLVMGADQAQDYRQVQGP